MKINTRVFGEVDIEESKILTFPGGIVGFPDMEKFTLIHDEEKGNKSIKWMQSLDEPAFAMPARRNSARLPFSTTRAQPRIIAGKSLPSGIWMVAISEAIRN